MVRRTAFVVLALLALALQQGGEARANCSRPDSPGSFAKEAITVSTVSIGFTAATYNDANGHAFAALVTVETANIRFWTNGSAPTTTDGHVVTAGGSIEICGTDNVKNFRAIRDDAADATLMVSYLR